MPFRHARELSRTAEFPVLSVHVGPAPGDPDKNSKLRDIVKHLASLASVFFEDPGMSAVREAIASDGELRSAMDSLQLALEYVDDQSHSLTVIMPDGRSVGWWRGPVMRESPGEKEMESTDAHARVFPQPRSSRSSAREVKLFGVIPEPSNSKDFDSRPPRISQSAHGKRSPERGSNPDPPPHRHFSPEMKLRRILSAAQQLKVEVDNSVAIRPIPLELDIMIVFVILDSVWKILLQPWHAAVDESSHLDVRVLSVARSLVQILTLSSPEEGLTRETRRARKDESEVQVGDADERIAFTYHGPTIFPHVKRATQFLLEDLDPNQVVLSEGAMWDRDRHVGLKDLARPGLSGARVLFESVATFLNNYRLAGHGSVSI